MQIIFKRKKIVTEKKEPIHFRNDHKRLASRKHLLAFPSFAHYINYFDEK